MPTKQPKTKLAFFIIIALVSAGSLGYELQQMNSIDTQITDTKNSISNEKKHNKNLSDKPKEIVKKVPSIYKGMLKQGHDVINAEQTLGKLSTDGKGNIDKNTKEYKESIAVIKQNISNIGSSWKPDSTPWTIFSDWNCQLVPSGINANGYYNCAFVYKDKDNNVVSMILGQYNPSDKGFTNLNQYFTNDGINQINQRTIDDNPDGIGR